MTKKTKLLLMAATMFTTQAMAQKLLTLEDVMGGGSNYATMAPKSMRTQWWGNTPVETTDDEVKDLNTGHSLCTVSDINNALGDESLEDAKRLTFPIAGEPVALVKGKDKWRLANWQTKEVEATLDVPDGSKNHDLHAASLHLAYTVQGNLYVTDAKGNTRKITQDGSEDGSEDIVYGTSVHRDEFGIYKGTFWSPDGSRLAFYRMDQSMVPSYPQVDITKRIAQTYADHYPMAGTTSHVVTVGVYDLAKDTVTWLKLVGEKDDYHTNIAWSPDARTIYIFELNRAQTDLRLVAYDATSGEVKGTILEEHNDKYVEPMHPIQFLPWDDSKAIMQSQRDGFNHIYLLDLSRQPATVTQLTHGSWVVQAVLGFNAKTKSIIYQSNEGDPLTSLVHSVTLKGKTAQLGDQDGVHYGRLSPDGTQLLDVYSSPSVPRKVDLIDTGNGHSRNLLTATDPWAEQGYAIPETLCGTIKAADGQTDLYYRMVRPINFDPSQKYPTVVYVYGGPHAHNVEASWHWSMRGWEAYMATKGYLLFILDNRGAEWRGLDFEQVTFHHLGDVEMEDQMAGVEFLKSLPYVDADRLGVHGWSYGGYMTTNLMCTYPDVFKVGVAGGPVIDWKYYEVMYGERYMGTPETNPDGYRDCALTGKAKNLQGRLQIIYGYNDPTCVPQHTLSFIRAAADAGVQPDLFTYPGDGHNMFGRDQIHLHERITRYFEDYLK